jgi:hypothetical protein
VVVAAEEMVEALKATVRGVAGGASRCVVCLERVRPEQSMWPCGTCHSLLHLDCISRWVRSCVMRRALDLDRPDPDPRWQWYGAKRAGRACVVAALA